MHRIFFIHTFQSALFSFLVSLLLVSCNWNKGDGVKPDNFIADLPVQSLPPNGRVANMEKVGSFSANNLAIAASFLGFSEFIPLVKEDVTVYKLEYYTNFKEDELLVSALICVPKNTSTETPWLSFHHGTILKKSDAPTVNQNDFIQYALFSSTGYITVIPDYIGYGASEDNYHPYYIKESITRTVSDGLIASKQVSKDSNWVASKDLFLIGYSEGGYVTMAMHEYIQSNPLQHFNLITSAAGAGGYNLVGIMDTLFDKQEYESPGYLALLLDSYRRYYDWEKELNDIFREPYASQIPNLIAGDNGLGTVNNALPNNLDSLLVQDFKNSLEEKQQTAVLTALKKNSTYQWTPEKPLQMFHGTDDMVVPLSDSEVTFSIMQKNGGNVSYTSLDGENHSSGALKMIELVIPYFETFRQ